MFFSFSLKKNLRGMKIIFYARSFYLGFTPCMNYLNVNEIVKNKNVKKKNWSYKTNIRADKKIRINKHIMIFYVYSKSIIFFSKYWTKLTTKLP